jgi:hypothetical protein
MRRSISGDNDWRKAVAGIAASVLAIGATFLSPIAGAADDGRRIDVQLTPSGPWIAHLVNFDISSVESVTYYTRDAQGRWRWTDPVNSQPFDAPIEWWQGNNDGYEVVTAHVTLTSGQVLKDPGGWHWVNGHHTAPGGSITAWINPDGTPGAAYTPDSHLADMTSVEFWFRDANDKWHDVGAGARSGEDADWLLQRFTSLPDGWQGPENAVSVHVIWPGGHQLVDPANWATDLTAPPDPVPSAIGPASTACGNPHDHVYKPDRLRLLAPCVTVTGVIDAVRKEADGDLHVLLHLDGGQSKYLNGKNALEEGDLVLEPVCVNQPTQVDADQACAGFTNPLTIPPVGSHVSASGAWVLDLDHGWMEIHPVSAFGPPYTVPSPKPSPKPSPPTTAPPAVAFNYCGAPVNPWHYNFCAGNAGRYIYAPNAAICSYFPCIVSFWRSTNGYVVECVDGMYSHSGGVRGSCSYHGGELRPLWA